jgi:cytochrome c553
MPADEREARAARGAALYSQHFCAQCHEGLRAEEGVIVVPLANLASRYTVPDLMAFLAAPTPPMPALGLSDDERRDLAVHLLSAHP